MRLASFVEQFIYRFRCGVLAVLGQFLSVSDEIAALFVGHDVRKAVVFVVSVGAFPSHSLKINHQGAQ